MTAIVNGKRIDIFDGATVEHAIRKFSPEALKDIKQGTAYVTDRFGNHVALSGTLTENDVLTVRQVC